MKQFLFSVALIAASATVATAHTLDGIVKDNRTGEPLIGSVVEVKELPSVKTTTGLDGSFTLHELPDKGRYTLVVRYISYKTREIPVDVSDKGIVNITLDEDSHELGEVVIKGHKEYHSDRSAIDMEKTAGNVLNVMSQQSIQLSPDVNVATVLQRVSGVTMERDASGEASYAILRGMDKRYNYTLVNGVKIPSPDDKNRYIPLNIFPSDLMDRLVVSKSLTSDMEGDAAGGVVDMVMKDAPSHFQIQANAAVGTSDYFWKDSRDYLTSNRSDYTHKSPYEVNGPEYKATTSDFASGPTQDDETRSLSQTQSIFATHIKGTHHLTKDFTVDWAGIFSQAKSEDPDRVYLSLTNTIQSAEGVDGSLWSGNKNILKTMPKNMERRFQHNTDKDWAGYINLTYNTQLGNDINALWKAGAQYRRKERGNRFYSYNFTPTDISQKLDGNGFDQFAAIDWTCKTPYSQASQLNYDSKEHIGAAYIMTTLKSRWGELNAGLRAEHTNQIYTMLQKFRNMGQVGEQSYWDWLPSASLKWTPTKKMNVRLSYYRSINRPGFYEIVPYQIMGEEYQEKGNPNLKRARIDNVDLRWEWFPSATEQVLAGVFYKYLQDPIEQVFVAADGKLGSGADAYYMPDNLGNAKNYGFEIDVVKYIRHFGIKANHTYTHSTITTTKREYKEGSAEYKTGVTQTRPLVNQAPHTANLSLLYKDTNYGWNAQLAASYTGTKLALVSPFKDADQWDKAMFGLDFSMEKKFPCGVSVFLKANNLLDAKRERYLKTVNQSNLEYEGQSSDKTIVGTYKYGRTYLVGVRVKI